MTGVTGGGSSTTYSDPHQLGKFWAFTLNDWVNYAVRQGCK
jgi:hypothetical protein